jgi:hypothetical protein
MKDVSKLNKPKPIPVFQIKSIFRKSFKIYVLSLNLFIISIFENLSKININNINIIE